MATERLALTRAISKALGLVEALPDEAFADGLVQELGEEKAIELVQELEQNKGEVNAQIEP